MWWFALQGCVFPWELASGPDAEVPAEWVALGAPTPFPLAPARFRPTCLAGDGRTGAKAPPVAPPWLFPLLLPSCASRDSAPEPSTETVADRLVLPEPMALSPAPTADRGIGGSPKPSALPRRAPVAAEPPADADDRLGRAEGQGQAPTVPAGRDFDWGGTTFLSNDDSMSLASAQRILYALSHREVLRPSEIRPHELLNYFTFDTVEPPPGQTFGVLGAAERDGDRFTLALAVRGASPPRPPLDLTVVVDRSGSMNEQGKMGLVRRGLLLLGEQLAPGDRIDVVLFDTAICTPLEGFVVGRDDPTWLASTFAGIEARGGTDLRLGLEEAWRIQTSRSAAETHGRDRRILVVTDAILNSGTVDPNLVADVGARVERDGIRLSGIGVGRDFDDTVLDALTEKGRGAYVYAGSEAVVERVFGAGFDSLVGTVASDVQFSLDLPPSLAMKRFYGEEMSTSAEDVQPIHYQSGTSQLFLQDLALRDGRVVEADPVVVRISYRHATTGEPQLQELRTTVGALLASDPHNLKKARALMAFSDLVLAWSTHAAPCEGPYQTWRERADLLPGDAELVFVDGLVGGLCGVPGGARVDLKVRVDSDVPVDEALLRCGEQHASEPLGPSDGVAQFRVRPGACTLFLSGAAVAAQVDVPSTGGDLRCVVRAGRLTCS